MTLARSTTVALWVCLLTACGTDPIQMSGDPATLPPFKSFRIDEEQFVFATEISEEQRAEVSRKLRGAAVSALETIRLNLLRLHAGSAAVEGLTTHIGLAEEVSDEIERMVAARTEIEASLRFPRTVEPTPV